MSNERSGKDGPSSTRRTVLEKHSRIFLPAVFLTLVVLNVTRVMCLRYCLNWIWYKRILYDDIHHYQLGILLIPIGFLVLKTYPRARTILFGVATAFILDELFFIMELFGMDPYFHRTFLRWVSFDLVAFIVFVSLYNLLKKRVSSIYEIDER